MTPVEGSKDSEKFESSDRLTDHDGDDHKLFSQATESLKAEKTQLDLSPQHRWCTTILILDALFSDRSLNCFNYLSNL